MPSKSRNFTRFYKGVLETSELSEVAYFLKGAKKNLSYAEAALENTSFSSSCGELKDLAEKVELLSRGVVSISEELELVEQGLIREISRRESEEPEKSEEKETSEESNV